MIWRDYIRGRLPTPDDDVVEELAQHAAASFEAARADGLSREAAEARVVELVNRWLASGDACTRRPQRLPAIEPPPAISGRAIGLLQDFRYGFRLARRQPAQRAREIGVRAALGATPADIVRLVAGQGLLLTAGGLLVGLLAAFELVTVVGQFLYGVTARDPVSFAAAAAVVVVVAAVATFIPARRAARIDPLTALKR